MKTYNHLLSAQKQKAAERKIALYLASLYQYMIQTEDTFRVVYEQGASKRLAEGIYSQLHVYLFSLIDEKSSKKRSKMPLFSCFSLFRDWHQEKTMPFMEFEKIAGLLLYLFVRDNCPDCLSEKK